MYDTPPLAFLLQAGEGVQYVPGYCQLHCDEQLGFAIAWRSLFSKHLLCLFGGLARFCSEHQKID